MTEKPKFKHPLWSTLLGTTIAVMIAMVTPVTAEEPHWSDALTRRDWEVKKADARTRYDQAMTCLSEKYRIGGVFETSANHLIQNDRRMTGGYIPTGVAMREESRMLKIAYEGFDALKRVRYSLASHSDPVSVCKNIADRHIERIERIISKYP
jgi:hypothetical protein